MPEASVIHRALASPTRERLMEVLREEDAPMSSRELGPYSYDLLASVVTDRLRLDHPDAGQVVEETAAA